MSDRWHELPRTPVLVRASVVAAGCAALSPTVASANAPSSDDVDGTLRELKKIAAHRSGDVTEGERAWFEALLPTSGTASAEQLALVEALLLHPDLGRNECSLLLVWLEQHAEHTGSEQPLLILAAERYAELKAEEGEEDEQVEELEPPPTCGPCCHGSCDEDGPPPISKRWGCALDTSSNTTSALLVLLALAWRRRRQG